MTIDNAITLLSAWTAVTLLIVVAMMLSRPGKCAIDYAVIGFKAAMAAFFVLIWLRRVIEWPPWVAVVYFVIAAVSSSVLLLLIAREIHHERGP